VLARLEKGVDSAEMIRVARKAHEAGVKLSTMILLGAGNRAGSRAHARASAAVVNAIQPRFVSTLVMTPVEDTPLFEQAERGWSTSSRRSSWRASCARSSRDLELEGTVFRSNHASNYLALAGNLPRDKAKILSALDHVLAHPADARFAPEWMRGL
jgi:hypothetical protein